MRLRFPRFFRRLPPGELLEAAEAFCALSFASLAIQFLPFRKVVGLMRFGGSGRALSAQDSAAAAAAVRRAVKRVGRRLPWRIVCFHEALAVHWMLRRRSAQSRLHYGVRQTESGLGAHVWVSLDGQIVIGEEEADGHACVAVFPPTPSP